METKTMMHMWFYQGEECVFLFKDLHTTNLGGYIAGLIVTFLMSALIEFLSLAILMIKIKIDKKNLSPVVGNVFVILLYALQMTDALAVMLLVMTFNYIICLAVVVGVVFGYAIFGFWKMDIQAKNGDKSYSCVAEK